MTAKEVIYHCEGCGNAIREGDRFHGGLDVELCEQCAPTYEDMLSSPSHFRGVNDIEMAPDEARRICDGHIADGGSLTDKLVTTV
jgi:hypothetical protein